MKTFASPSDLRRTDDSPHRGGLEHKKEPVLTKDAKKKPAKKKLTLGKETVRKLSDKELGKVAGGMRKATGGSGQGDSYSSCNMKCCSDPTACKCP
jgi:hypothetical protein